MFTKKVKEVRDLQDEVSHLEKKIRVLASDINHGVKSEFKKMLRRKLNKEVQVKFESVKFGSFKRKRVPAKLTVISLNGQSVTINGEWTNLHNIMTVEEFEDFCYQASEELGIEIQVRQVLACALDAPLPTCYTER